ncbi:MAG: type IV toxin-antitoxin system AbiEi family antitoxin domain-containing protein [Lachnospiraceae bacterium]|jgi:predicted transcriptional regulator of viral defense system|nr:type IV toxin-antitoxin system AbiEi family antitoxin domain-containing protein [Lachnospiraceae bacterium]MBR6396842.1 type IV toxin-antitoxin system AbiEi family antitoxin domain-containing protein [Lachnospiraceae bacterium]
MLKTTYDRIIKLLKDGNGYASFATLRENKVTVSQMRELEEKGVVERFARGWYWACGIYDKKPKKYKYIELCQACPEAVICGLSACYLNGIIEKEPEVISYVTDYSSRRTGKMQFDTKKFYHDTSRYGDNIVRKNTKYGQYAYLNTFEAVKDLVHCQNKVDKEALNEVVMWLEGQTESKYQALKSSIK